MTVAVLLFLLGLLLLIKGGDWFVDGSTGIAHKLHMPEFIIGATVVSIGTTLPEVMVSATSAVTGHGEIAYGNAIGSIICNTALIAAITLIVRPAKIERSSLVLPVSAFFVAAVFYSVISYVFSEFTRLIGIVLMLMFVLYIVLTVVLGKKNKVKEDVDAGDEKSNGSVPKYIVLLVVGAALIATGAKLLVDNGTVIAKSLGVPESVIALTFVALGTSLPELVTAIVSLVKGHSALSLGNIVGANLFNIVLVSGVSTVLSPFALPDSKLIGGMNASLVVDIPLMLGVMALLTLPAIIRGKLSRVQGIVLVAVYISYCVFQFAV